MGSMFKQGGAKIGAIKSSMSNPSRLQSADKFQRGTPKQAAQAQAPQAATAAPPTSSPLDEQRRRRGQNGANVLG